MLRSHASIRFNLLKMMSTACWRRHHCHRSQLSRRIFLGICSGRPRAFRRALKLAFVVAPNGAEAARAFWPGVRATYWMASPVSAALMADLISSGADLKILSAVKVELAARHLMVVNGLAGKPLASDPGCLHVWMPLENGSSNVIAARILRHGVQVVTAAAYVADGSTPPEALRIGIGNPESRSVLEEAISRIRCAML